MKTFVHSFGKAGSILIPAIILTYIYAVVGLHSFSSNNSLTLDLEHSKCRDPANLNKTANWTVYDDEIFLCGEKSCQLSMELNMNASIQFPMELNQIQMNYKI